MENAAPILPFCGFRKNGNGGDGFQIKKPGYLQSPSREQISFPPLAGGTNLPATLSLARQAEGGKIDVIPLAWSF